MSFYFNCNNLLSLNTNKILNRFLKLLIPYVGWPIIILQINKIYVKTYNKKLNEKFREKFPYSFEALKSQILWGAEYIGQFWFQWDLIATILIFVLIIFIFRQNYLFIFQLLLILFYYFQYTGNYLKNI